MTLFFSLYRRAVFYYWKRWFSDVCADRLRQFFSYQCKDVNDTVCGDSFLVGRSSTTNMKQKRCQQKNALCSSSERHLGVDTTNTTVGEILIQSKWLRKDVKFNGRLLVDTSISLPDISTELTFCEEAITSCKTNINKHQVKFAINYKRWLHLLT